MKMDWEVESMHMLRYPYWPEPLTSPSADSTQFMLSLRSDY